MKRTYTIPGSSHTLGKWERTTSTATTTGVNATSTTILNI